MDPHDDTHTIDPPRRLSSHQDRLINEQDIDLALAASDYEDMAEELRTHSRRRPPQVYDDTERPAPNTRHTVAEWHVRRLQRLLRAAVAEADHLAAETRRVRHDAYDEWCSLSPTRPANDPATTAEAAERSA